MRNVSLPNDWGIQCCTVHFFEPEHDMFREAFRKFVETEITLITRHGKPTNTSAEKLG